MFRAYVPAGRNHAGQLVRPGVHLSAFGPGKVEAATLGMQAVQDPHRNAGIIARLDQAHGMRGVLREPVSQHATG